MEFGPRESVNRAQAVTFLWRLDGSKTGAENPFTDIAEDAYYYEAVKWANANEITTGMTETMFSPDIDCVRAQVVTFLYRYAGK